MKFKFYYTNDAEIDDCFVADLSITPAEKAVTDGPADGWYPGAPLEYEINEIFYSHDLIHSIKDKNLLDTLSREIEKKYKEICDKYEEID